MEATARAVHVVARLGHDVFRKATNEGAARTSNCLLLGTTGMMRPLIGRDNHGCRKQLISRPLGLLLAQLLTTAPRKVACSLRDVLGSNRVPRDLPARCSRMKTLHPTRSEASKDKDYAGYHGSRGARNHTCDGQSDAEDKSK
jgi:hypothetical protein